MEPETAFYGVCAVFFFIISICADRDWSLSVICTGLLVSFWAINNIQWMFHSLAYVTLTDLAFTVETFVLYALARRAWCFVLSLLYASDVGFDVLYDHSLISYAVTAWSENIIFLMQLVVASLPGILTVLGLSSARRSSNEDQKTDDSQTVSFKDLLQRA